MTSASTHAGDSREQTYRLHLQQLMLKRWTLQLLKRLLQQRRMRPAACDELAASVAHRRHSLQRQNREVTRIRLTAKRECRLTLVTGQQSAATEGKAARRERRRCVLKRAETTVGAESTGKRSARAMPCTAAQAVLPMTAKSATAASKVELLILWEKS